jgi:hypothetical protein
MDPALLAFQTGGLAAANRANARTVTVTTKAGTVHVLTGTRTKVQVDPGEVQVGGFTYHYAFSLTVTKADLAMANYIPARGQDAVDDAGLAVKTLRWDTNHLGSKS